jgi:hypothetical protein
MSREMHGAICISLWIEDAGDRAAVGIFEPRGDRKKARSVTPQMEEAREGRTMGIKKVAQFAGLGY